MTTKAEPRRDWTTVGEIFPREDVEAAIATLTWERPPPTSFGLSTGLGIEEAIMQLQIPKVSGIAVEGGLEIELDGERCYPALYGIEGNYLNGRALVYIVDMGTKLIPVAIDFYEKED